ncbi:MAG: hypothetical protein GY827_05640 [Cytophagales bacterium]|nr:hypothetical protein [Cytophagales bacterium]
MKKRIILASALSFSMLFFSSCGNDDEEVDGGGTTTTELTTAETKTTLDNVANSLKTDMSAMAENQSLDAFNSFAEVSSNLDGDEAAAGARQSKKTYKEYINTLEEAFDDITKVAKLKSAIGVVEVQEEEEEFDFATSTGIYEWDADIEDFKNTGTSSELVIKFPSTDGGTTNDAQLTITEYAEDDNENLTALDIDVQVDGSTILDIDAEAVYNDDDEPTMLDASISMNPYTYSVEFKQTSTNVALSTGIESSNLSVPIVSTSIDATFEDASYEELLSFKGDAQMYEVTLNADVDVKTINTAEDDEDADMEAIVNEAANVYFSVTSTGQKIGDVVLEEVEGEGEEDGDVIAYVQYADDTKEDLETVFEGVIDELEGAIEELGLDSEEEDDSDFGDGDVVFVEGNELSQF